MQRPLAYTVLAGTAAIACFAAVATTHNGATPAATDEHAGQVMCVEFDNVAACFAPGTDPMIIKMVSDAIQSVDNSRYQTTGRWPGSAGTPVNLTYSFPADGLSIPSGVGEGTGSNSINATMTSRFGSVAAGKAKFAQAFSQWAAHTGNTYTEVSDDNAPFFNSPGPLHGGSGRGDIRIAAKFIDGGSGILAYNFFPGSTGGDMVIDQNENWGSSFNDFRFFRNTITHEHGHGMGLLHVCPIQNNKLMEPFLATNFDGPQHDDIRGAQFHYGDRFEPNNNAGSATFLGFFDMDGSASETSLSIRTTSGDTDFFSIDMDNSGTLGVTVTPTGLTYTQGPQTGSCNTGSSTNSLTQIDLELTVFDTNGTTVLASANNTNAGSSESVSGVVLPAAGTYYVSVKSDTTIGSGAAQLYNISLSVTVDELVACIADLNGDGIVDTADLGILLNDFGGHGALASDLNGDMVVDTADLGILLGVFGTCTTM
ncbi:MAG: matrixin family metalloprotease [Phycisphaeraceae bacterium]|nr:matrixin family metalloprotease [Phycisphaeraceae bacterium]